jgi:hypothetical protein
MVTSLELGFERRRSARTRAFFPLELHHNEGAPITALARDVSAHGVQLLSPVIVSLKKQLALLMYPSDPETCVAATGTVVRIIEHEEVGLWKYVLCVSFDEPVPSIEPEAEAISERQRAVGL